MKRVAFILKPDNSEANELVCALVPWLRERGDVPLVADEDQIAVDGADIVPEVDLGVEADLCMVLGGDGTMLRASHLVADHAVPVLGINLGRLGFLTPFRSSEAQDALQAALEGTLSTTERSRLQITYRPKTGDPVVRSALNDVVIHQGAMARLIELEAYVDDALVTAYRADGLIVATPTGSTAYNLAAGGPIIMPGQESMTITPICAHALTHRPLVVPRDAVMTVRLGGDSRGVVLTVDGQWAHSFYPGDEVRIGTSAAPLILFKSDKSYFDILREKLHWGRTPIG